MTLLEKKHSITQIEKVLYTGKAHTTGGRDGGTSRSSDGRLRARAGAYGWLYAPGGKAGGRDNAAGGPVL
jgi:hypothetical protein